MVSSKAMVGYDCEFISETPDYITCSICHLVMRNPVMIITCGHKFCQPCYDRMRVYFTDRNLLFCCPVDRNVIDQSKVCEDAGLRRAIGNLIVKCSNSGAGCLWQGDLSEAEVHLSSCTHSKPQVAEGQAMRGCQVITDERLKELHEHVGRCDREISELKRINSNLEKDILRLSKQCDAQKNDFEEERIYNSIQREMVRKEMRSLNEVLASRGIKSVSQVHPASFSLNKNKIPTNMLANIPWIPKIENAAQRQTSSQVKGGSTLLGKQDQINATPTVPPSLPWVPRTGNIAQKQTSSQVTAGSTQAGKHGQKNATPTVLANIPWVPKAENAAKKQTSSQVKGGSTQAGKQGQKNATPTVPANIPWVPKTENAAQKQTSSQVKGGSTQAGKRGQRNTTNKNSKKLKASPLTE